MMPRPPSSLILYAQEKEHCAASEPKQRVLEQRQ